MSMQWLTFVFCLFVLSIFSTHLDTILTVAAWMDIRHWRMCLRFGSPRLFLLISVSLQWALYERVRSRLTSRYFVFLQFSSCLPSHLTFSCLSACWFLKWKEYTFWVLLGFGFRWFSLHFFFCFKRWVFHRRMYMDPSLYSNKNTYVHVQLYIEVL